MVTFTGRGHSQPPMFSYKAATVTSRNTLGVKVAVWLFLAVFVAAGVLSALSLLT
jgi:hypothetical protein